LTGPRHALAGNVEAGKVAHASLFENALRTCGCDTLSRLFLLGLGLYQLRLWALAKNDLAESASIRLHQPTTSAAVAVVALVIPPCRPDLGVRAVFENIHPAFELYSLHRVGRVAVLPELAENSFGSNPNLGPMCLLLLR
jgi:hypothetical protein